MLKFSFRYHIDIGRTNDPKRGKTEKDGLSPSYFALINIRQLVDICSHFNLIKEKCGLYATWVQDWSIEEQLHHMVGSK